MKLGFISLFYNPRPRAWVGDLAFIYVLWTESLFRAHLKCVQCGCFFEPVKSEFKLPFVARQRQISFLNC